MQTLMQKTPAFQWCCREERSTPEKCAGHIAEFERTLLLNHTFKVRARARPFISAPRGPRVTSFCGMCRGEFGRLEELLPLPSPLPDSVAFVGAAYVQPACYYGQIFAQRLSTIQHPHES
jgi:hypothetical protein